MSNHITIAPAMQPVTFTAASSLFTCAECCDTETIDRGGAEIACPYCTIEVKLTGLSHGLGNEGEHYGLVVAYTPTTITFVGRFSSIMSEVRRVRAHAESVARQQGAKGRNRITSGALAIERLTIAALAQRGK